MLFWSCVDFTSDRLLLNVLWTDSVCLGTRLEQMDLAFDFGDIYEKYRGLVPMLIPWHRPVGM
jgi:protein-S-isoprenylcysteine O-methyltransferase Ste14